MDPVEDLVPFPLVLLYRDGLLLGQVAAGRVYRLLAVYPRGYEGRQSARDLLALAPHRAEGLYSALGGTADLAADVPAAEAVVLAAVALPDLVDHVLVRLDLV